MVVATEVRTAVRFEEATTDAELLAAVPGRTRFLVVPERRYLMLDGRGEPGSPAFRAAFAALYPVAYTLHFMLKRRGVTERVGAIEGLYWFGEIEHPITPGEFGRHDRDAWNWRLILPVPPAATPDEVARAFADVARKKAPAALALLRVEPWAEGASAQTLHVGPYSTETETIAALHRSIEAAGLRPRGCHHEIYISDPNRTAPDRLKTIIRQPVEPDAPSTWNRPTALLPGPWDPGGLGWLVVAGTELAIAGLAVIAFRRRSTIRTRADPCAGPPGGSDQPLTRSRERSGSGRPGHRPGSRPARS